MATLKQALQYASQNPDSDFAKFLIQRIVSGQADIEARQSGIDLTPIKKSAQIQESQPEEPGYFSRVSSGFQQAGQEIISNIEQGTQKIQEAQQSKSPFAGLKAFGSMLRTGLRTAGTVAKTVFEPIVEAPIIKPALEKIGEGITKIPGAEQAILKLNTLAEKYPQESKDIQNVIDIIALTGLKTVEKPVGTITGEIATKAGRTIEKSGLAAQKAIKESFAKDLVMPLETKRVKLEQVGRTTEKGVGLFKKSIVAPTVLEQRAIDEVAKIPEVSSSKTFQQNFNFIKEANKKKAGQLINDIKTNDFIVPKKELLSRLNQAATNLNDNPVIVGDAEKTAQKLVEGAKKFIIENDGTGSGILQARKDYDNWVLNQKPKAFDPKVANAFSIANREVRQTMNEFLEEKAPNVGIKQSLQEQSSLFYALDNIAPKAAEEADTAILRVMNRVGKTLGTKNKIVQAIAAGAGIGGLGAAATFAPSVAVLGGAGFIIYKGGQLILKPEVRILVGRLLKETGKLLNPGDKKILENILNTYSEAKE